MSRDYLLTIDQSTSATKALIVDRAGEIVAKCSIGHQTYYPEPGWVEQDADEIYANVERAAVQALQLAGIDAGRLAALTITNQRETAVVWDRETGKPLHRAIVWQCQRTAAMCQSWQQDGYESVVRQKTGLLLDPYFSASKWRWLLDHAPIVREKLDSGSLLTGTIDSWLIWKLTGGRSHMTDYTNASRTSLFNIHSLEWDDELCGLFGVPRHCLPEVKHSDEWFGDTADMELFAESIPITGVIGDSQAALFGQRCVVPGMAKATYGTGTSVLMNTGDTPVAAANGLVTAIAWGLAGKVTYALEAVIRTSGDCVKWVRDELQLFDTDEELDELLAAVPHNEGVYLVPAFVGLGAPYWKPDARAAIVGLSRGCGKAHIARAAVESMAYQVREAVELMQQESGIELRQLLADGGASSNERFMQFQADMLQRAVVKSDQAELSALGSAYIGGFKVGFWNDEQAEGRIRGSRIFSPLAYAASVERDYAGWKRAVRMVLIQDVEV